MNIKFVDMDNDGVKEMIVRYCNRYNESYYVRTEVYTIINDKAERILQNQDPPSWDTTQYGICSKNGKTYLIRYCYDGVNAEYYIFDKQNNSINFVMGLSYDYDMGYYSKIQHDNYGRYEYIDLTEAEYNAIAGQYMNYDGISYIPDEFIPELRNDDIFNCIKNGVY